MSGYTKSTTTDPALSYTIKEFIEIGKEDDTISYADLSFRETIGNISYITKNVFEDYIEEFKRLSVKVQLSKEEYLEYRFNPKMLSYDIYGTTEYYIFILILNDMCNIREFDTDVIRMVPKKYFTSALSTIYSAEKKDIMTFNSEHN